MMYQNELIQILKLLSFDERGTAIKAEKWISHIISQLFALQQQGKSLYFIGNGGSAGIAIHMTADFLKNGKLRTHSMHDAATLTCLGNDFGYEYVFSKQLEIVADVGDLLVAISSSGCSANILRAAEIAKEKKQCHLVTFTGFKPDNPLRQMGDWNVYVPSEKYGIVESIHTMLLQQVVDELVAENK